MQLDAVTPTTILPMPDAAQHALAATWALARAGHLMQPATAPNFELRKTSRTSAVPMISSRISTPRMPEATCFTWSITS